MALDPVGAAIALHRFGFGPRAGSIAAIASDPRGALLAELDRPNVGQVSSSGLMTSAAINRVAFEFNAERQAKQRLETRRKDAEKQEAAERAGERVVMESPGMEKPMEAKADAPLQPLRQRPRPKPPSSRTSSERPRPITMPPSTPTSASSSVWYGSGRTISASMPRDGDGRRL